MENKPASPQSDETLESAGAAALETRAPSRGECGTAIRWSGGNIRWVTRNEWRVSTKGKGSEWIVAAIVLCGLLFSGSARAATVTANWNPVTTDVTGSTGNFTLGGYQLYQSTNPFNRNGLWISTQAASADPTVVKTNIAGQTTSYIATLSAPGTYYFRLTAYDSSGESGFNVDLSGNDVQVSTAVPPPPPVLTSIAVSPASASIASNGSQQFAATARDQYGNSMTGLAFSWASSNSAAATINSSGLAAGVNTSFSAQTSNITASAMGVMSAAAVLTVGASPQNDTTPPTVAITSPGSGSTLKNPVTVYMSGSDNVAVAQAQLWIDGALNQSTNFSPAVPSFNITFSYTGSYGTHTLQAKAVDTSGNIGNSSLATISIVKKGKVTLLASGPGNLSTASGGESKAIVFSLKSGYSQTLSFDPDIQEASLITVSGRKLVQQSSSGGGITIPLQGTGDSGVSLESGLLLIQMKDNQGKTSVVPLIVVK